ncbi:MAG: dihydrofolate reductase [Oscillospiraceae bacterium]|nr:dihydrofolate reductase [Oscillospiraceae bacterium]
MNLIVAVDRNWAIGKDGDQLVYIPADLKRFQTLTMGHALILGRKTLATFPKGRPLAGRRNLILSRDSTFSAEGGEVFRDLDSLLVEAPEDAFVVGGESVYYALLPHCDTAYVTKIDHTYPADAFFPNLDTDAQWYLAQEEEPQEHAGLRFRYLTYRRR